MNKKHSLKSKVLVFLRPALRQLTAGMIFFSIVMLLLITIAALRLNARFKEKSLFHNYVTTSLVKHTGALDDAVVADSGARQVEMRLAAVDNKKKMKRVAYANDLASAQYNRLDPSKPLSMGQRQIVSYLAKRYRLSADSVASIVRLAFKVGKEEHVPPTLILAIVSIESSFDPLAASPVGAKGLMQVMPHIHREKFEKLSPGDWSALNPEMNMRVGAKIIREYTQRTGSVQEGLRWYVGAAVHRHDGGYVNKVLAMQARIDSRFNESRVLVDNKPDSGTAKSDKISAAVIKLANS
jgi:soluble lytic murein transglycosylase-like protein